MRLKFTYILLSAIFLWTINTSEKTGMSSFTDCAGCHSGSSSTSTVDSITLTEVSSGQVVTKYKPATAYTIKFFGKNSASLAKFGFQVKASSGTISAPATNSKLTSGYWQHSTPNTGTSGKYTSSATWTSPASGSGNVTFESWLNAVDGNDATSGDAVSSLFSRIVSELVSVPADTAMVSIAITAGTNPSNPGASVTFKATPTNGGTTPSYQWKVNGTNVGTNSNTYTTTTLTQGALVQCIMTSNLSGVVGSPASSNIINMTVKGIGSISKELISEIKIQSTHNSRIFKVVSDNPFLIHSEISDLNGKILSNKVLDANKELNLEHLSTGIYIIRLKIRDFSITRKIAIE